MTEEDLGGFETAVDEVFEVVDESLGGYIVGFFETKMVDKIELETDVLDTVIGGRGFVQIFEVIFEGMKKGFIGLLFGQNEV